MRLLAVFLCAGLAHADTSTPDRRPEWAACRAALEAAAQALAAEDNWGWVAEDPDIQETADSLTLSMDFSTGCMHHGGASVVIRRGKKPKLDYWDENRSETGTKQEPAPFYARMRKAVRACRGGR